ncbi:MAG: acyl-ACP--UDP-N-acetylglucosamine O-acyltransferase [Alphaproteobacteria bacterium]|nr:acyl-ACP--UDP-N-acetylglucosamine O-acyltransferase [Alphaproteobacteria bacterium]
MTHPNIHPTAIIETGAQVAEDVIIGPYCVIGPHVKIAAKVCLKSHVVVEGRTHIGEGTTIYPFASIGAAPQDLKYAGEDSQLIIGKNNTIREHVTMNPGTKDGGMITRVGDNGLFMMACHVAHDCQVGNNVIMANNATLAGHVTVGDHVIIGGLAAVHQFIRIGDHAIIGGMSGVENDVIPYGRVKGERAHLAGLNLIGLERRGFQKEDIRALQRAFNQLFGEEGTLDQRIEGVANDYAQDETIMKIIEFARGKTKFPLCQPQKKSA